MNVLIYETFTHISPVALGLVEGFTELGWETTAYPACAGTLAEASKIACDLVVSHSHYTRPEDVSAIRERPHRPRFALVHSPDKPHELCPSADACFAMGRTEAFADPASTCIPLPFASSLNVPDAPRVWDFVFIGSWGAIGHGFRGQNKIAEAAARARPGRALLVGGAGGPESAFVPSRLLGWLYASALVGANPLYPMQLSRPEVNQRAYDLARCGVAQVTNSEAVARALMGAAVLAPVSELPQAVSELLYDSVRARKLGKGAQAVAMDKHRWRDRARAIVEATL